MRAKYGSPHLLTDLLNIWLACRRAAKQGCTCEDFFAEVFWSLEGSLPPLMFSCFQSYVFCCLME